MKPLFQPARFLEWMRGALSTRTFPCHRVLFEATGRLRIELGDSPHPIVCLLGAKDEGPVNAAFGSLVCETSAAPPEQWQVAAQAVAARLAVIVRRYWVPIFDLFQPNAPTQPYTFGRGLFHDRIGPFLVPGRTQYYRLLYAGEKFDGTGLQYRFEWEDGSIVIRVVLDTEVESPAFRTAHLLGTVIVDDRSHEQRSDHEWQVERYLGFLLARCDWPWVKLERPASRKLVVLDSSNLPWGGELTAQFFQENPGHDLFGNFAAVNGIRGPVGLIVHSERECANMGTHVPVPIIGFLPKRWKAVAEPGLWRRYFTTDIDEWTAINGAEARLTETMMALGSTSDLRIILVLQTCLIRVIGDDVSRCIRLCNAESACRFVDMDVGRQEQIDPFVEIRKLWKCLIDVLACKDLPRIEGAVNLVGYGNRKSRVVQELEALLSRYGVALNACLFPGLDLEEAKRFEAASMHVVYPWYYVVESFSGISQDSKVPTLVACAPYGFEGTMRWLEEVVSAVKGERPQLSLPVSPSDLEAWQRAREQSSQCGVAWVVASLQTHSLLDASRSYGVFMPGLLAEMGFPIYVLCYDPPEVRGRPERLEPCAFESRLRAMLGPDANLDFQVAENESEIKGFLARPEIKLVYSDMRDDPRIREARKAQFSVEDLEMGFLGAIRTALRLLRFSKQTLVDRFYDLWA